MENTIEIWKNIAGYESIYQVSSRGVRSLDRTTKMNLKHPFKKINGREMKPNLNTNGYLTIRLSKAGKSKLYFLHRIIAEAFIPNLDNKPQVNHKNGIKTDNRIENLEWCTPSENAIHASKSGLLNTIKGDGHPRTKITESDVIEIKELSKTKTNAEIGVMYNIRTNYVWQIVNNKRRKT